MLHVYAITHLLSYGMCFMGIILSAVAYWRTHDKLVLYQGLALIGASLFLIAQLIDLYMSVGNLFQHTLPFESFFVIGLYLSTAILFYVIPRFAYFLVGLTFPKILRILLAGLALTVLAFLALWLMLGKEYREGLLANIVIMMCDFLMLVNLGFFAVFLARTRHRITDPEVNRLTKGYVWVFLISLPFYGFEVFLCATEFIPIPYHFIFTPFMLLFWNLVNLRSLLRRLSQPSSTTNPVAFSLLLKKFGLTKREQEVADLLFVKCSYQEISEKLRISLPTVKTHIQNIYQKLDVTSRNEMVECLKKVSSQN